MEVPGIENAENFEVLVKEIEEHKLPIHRVSSVQLADLLYMDKAELKYYAQIGADAKIETLVNPFRPVAGTAADST
jgi:hypothetical protein